MSSNWYIAQMQNDIKYPEQVEEYRHIIMNYVGKQIFEVIFTMNRIYIFTNEHNKFLSIILEHER